MKTYFILLILILPFQDCFSQWNWLNPLPQGNDLHDVRFINPITGFAVGDGGTILKTMDSGLTWERINSGTIYDLVSISFVNENIGYIAGNNTADDIGFVLKTTNGGNDWTVVSESFWATLTSIFFTNETTGYLCGTWNLLYKTIDGGTNWFPMNFNPGDDFLSILFTDSNTGYLGGDVAIYKTADAGSTWLISYSDPGYPLFRSFNFTGPDTGHAVTMSGNILRTFNAGVTWEQQSSGISSGLTHVFFPNFSTGFITGNNGIILKTSDTGNTWYQQSSPVQDLLISIWFPTDTIGLIVGNHGSMIRTNNSGIFWNALSSHVTVNNLISICFPNNNLGFCVGDSGVIIKTNDGGNTWGQTLSGTTMDLRSICFTDLSTGYTCGNNIILKTADTGNSWFPVISGPIGQFSSLSFPSASTGYALLGYYNFIWKTTDFGVTWNSISLPSIQATSFFFTSNDTGYICGTQGRMQKTIDGGNTFFPLNIGITYDIHSVFFTDKNTGFISGGNGKILKTTDAGITWNEKYSGNVYPYCFTFPDAMNGFILGIPDCLKTNDNGETWTPFSVNLTNYEFRSIWFNNADTGFIVGRNGTIIKTISGGVPTGIHKSDLQNFINTFPNPNNGIFFIDIPFSLENVTIKIFDISGMQIYSTTNSTINIGINSIQLGHIKPGLYLLRVLCPKGVWTKKIIVD